MNVNKILITISQSSILITEITYKNTLGSTLKNNERTHLPLVNMDWANCRIKPHHRSTGGGWSTQRSVFPARLWTALRVQMSSSPLSARSWLVDGSSATPALAFGVFLSLFHVFPRSWAFASFLGPYFMGKIWIFRTTYCVATLGSVSLVSSSTRVLDLYAVRDPEWKSPDPRPIIRCNRSIIRRRLTDDRAGIARSLPGVGPL